MIARLVIAVAVGIVTWIVLLILGTVIAGVGLDWAATLGGLLVRFASLLGLVAALYEFFAGFTFTAKYR